MCNPFYSIYSGETYNIETAYTRLRKYLEIRHARLSTDEMCGELTKGTKGFKGLRAREVLRGKSRDYDMNTWLKRVEKEVAPYKAILHYLEARYWNELEAYDDIWDGMFEAIDRLKSPEEKLSGGEEFDVLKSGGYERAFSSLIEVLRQEFEENDIPKPYRDTVFLRENIIHFNREFFLNYFAPALRLDVRCMDQILSQVLGEFSLDYYDKDQFLLYLAYELKHSGEISFESQSEYQLLQDLKRRYDELEINPNIILKEYGEPDSQDTRNVGIWVRNLLQALAPETLSDVDQILKKHKAAFSTEKKRTVQKQYEKLWDLVIRDYAKACKQEKERDEKYEKYVNETEHRWKLDIYYAPGTEVTVPECTMFQCRTKGRTKAKWERVIGLETYKKQVFPPKNLVEDMVRVKAQTARPADDVREAKRKRGECLPAGSEIPVPEHLKKIGVHKIIVSEKVKVYRDNVDNGVVKLICEPGIRIPKGEEFCLQHTYSSEDGEKTISLIYQTQEMAEADRMIKGVLDVKLSEGYEETCEKQNDYKVYAEIDSDIECRGDIDGLCRVRNSDRLTVKVEEEGSSYEAGHSKYCAVVNVKTIRSDYRGNKSIISGQKRLGIENVADLKAEGYDDLEIYTKSAVRHKVSEKDNGKLEIRCEKQLTFRKGLVFRCRYGKAVYEFECIREVTAIKPDKAPERKTLRSEQEMKKEIVDYLYNRGKEDAIIYRGNFSAELWEKVMENAMLTVEEPDLNMSRNMRNQLLTLYFLDFVYENSERDMEIKELVDEFTTGAKELMSSVRLLPFYMRNRLDCIFIYFLLFDDPLEMYRICWSTYLAEKNGEDDDAE